MSLRWGHHHPPCLPRSLSQTHRQGYSQGQETLGALGQSQAGNEADDQVEDEEQEVGEPPGWRRRGGQREESRTLHQGGLPAAPRPTGASLLTTAQSQQRSSLCEGVSLPLLGRTQWAWWGGRPGEPRPAPLLWPGQRNPPPPVLAVH